MAQATDQDFDHSSLDLRELLRSVYRGWWILLFCSAISIWMASDYLRKATYLYPAQMQITPVQSMGDDSAGSRLGALGGLASLANIGLPQNQSATQFRLYVDTLYSRDLAMELAKNRDLMMTLFAGEWDQVTQSWREPPLRSMDEWRRSLRALLGFPANAWEAPGPARLQQFLMQRVVAIQDPRKPYLVKIIFNSEDPAFGISFLDLLNKAADNHLRQKALLRVRENIDYLSNKLGTVTIAEHRFAISQALSDQERFSMSASSVAPFAADVFDQPSVISTPAEPQPRKVLLTAALIGASIGAAIALAFNRWGLWIWARLWSLRSRREG